MSVSISDQTNFRHKNSTNRLHHIPTGACVTPTKQSKPIYSNIKYLCSENGNNTYMIDTKEMKMLSSSEFSHTYSLDSSMDDVTELDRLIEFHANASQRHSFNYDSNLIPLDSSVLSETFSNISWLDPKCSSEELMSEDRVKDCPKRDIKSHKVKHISGVASEQIRISIHETPKRTNLKPFERDKKQKPLRLTNLPRKIYTRGKNEVRIMKEDVKIVEPNSNNEMFDIKKHLARARRRLSFPLEDSFKTSSSSFISTKPQVDSHKNSSISITSSEPRDDFVKMSPRSSTSSIPQEDSVKISPLSVTSIKIREDSDKNTTGFIGSRENQEDVNIESLLYEVSDMEKRTVHKDNEYLSQKEKNIEELGGTFLLEDYLAKLKGISAKPPTTKRAKEFEKRTTSRTYFDFDDYCMQIFNLKEKFIYKQNKNKTV